ncbi:hypothetical protein QTV44_004120 [Vibrio vulnificus]|nr:hypothetical protein [Vibrio vulnificus]
MILGMPHNYYTYFYRLNDEKHHCLMCIFASSQGDSDSDAERYLGNKAAVSDQQ